MRRALTLICSTLRRGKCGPVGRVIKCLLSKSPTCVPHRGSTEGLVHHRRHSRVVRRLMGDCLSKANEIVR